MTRKTSSSHIARTAMYRGFARLLLGLLIGVSVSGSRLAAERASDDGRPSLSLDGAWQFRIDPNDEGASASLGGVTAVGEVYVNGQPAGSIVDYVTPFEFDITDLARIGSENVISVQVDGKSGCHDPHRDPTECLTARCRFLKPVSCSIRSSIRIGGT